MAKCPNCQKIHDKRYCPRCQHEKSNKPEDKFKCTSCRKSFKAGRKTYICPFCRNRNIEKV